MKLRIRQCREELGLTQKWLASRIGITPGALSSWEVQRTKISFEDAVRVANALGASITRLVEPGVFSEIDLVDAREERIARRYENMNERGRAALDVVSQALERDPNNRMNDPIDKVDAESNRATA